MAGVSPKHGAWKLGQVPACVAPLLSPEVAEAPAAEDEGGKGSRVVRPSEDCQGVT